ncbi:SCO family protein [Streptomyces sp. CA-111067]|uniref:SCO family protein n=1 Tax=Streptomyces sp. CA-111067 TaxID=3240046 RepID=UPI003D99C973
MRTTSVTSSTPGRSGSSRARQTRHTRAALASTAALAAGALLLTGCGSSGGSGGSGLKADSGNAAANIAGGSAPGAGTTLDTPFTKPSLVLTDNHGKPYDLVKETAGHPTLLFFGYTHCPDVCPTTMSDIALAKSELSKADQAELRIVMVSSDPERDTPARLNEWLGAMDKSFIGLTGAGKFPVIQAAARSVGVGLDKPKKEDDGSVTVTHGAEVLAFWPKDDKGHVLYMAGTTAQQYAKDLPKIIRSEAP